MFKIKRKYLYQMNQTNKPTTFIVYNVQGLLVLCKSPFKSFSQP